MTRLRCGIGSRKYAGILFTVLFLLFASSAVFAADPDDASSGSHKSMFDGIVENYGEFAFGWIGDVAAVALNILIGPFKYMILWNPDPVAMTPLVEGIISLLAPVYIVAIIISGFYFFFASNSPSTRARAKAMIQKLILSMVLVTLSMPMYRLLLDLSGAISQRILAGLEIQSASFLVFLLAGQVAVVALISASTLGLGLLIPIIAYLILVVLAAAVVGLRAYAVYLLAALFPITIFLYFFDYTKGFGEKMLNYTMGAIFTQVIMAISLAIAISCVNSMDSSNWITALFVMIIGEGAFLMIILAPLITLGLMQWIGGAVGAVGSVVAFMPVPGANIIGGAMTAVGGVAAGMGPGGLIAGGTVAGLGGAYYQRSQSMMPMRRAVQQPAQPTGEEYDERIVADAKTKYGGWMEASPGTAPQMESIDEEARIKNEAYVKYGTSNVEGLDREELEAQREMAYNSLSPEEQRAFEEGRVRGGMMGGGDTTEGEYWEKAGEYYEKEGTYDKAAESYENMGAASTSNPDAAADAYEKAGEMYEKLGNHEKVAESYEKASENNKKSGFDHNQDAAENLDKAAENRRKINQPVEAARDSEFAAKHWDNNADPKKAAESLENAVEDYATMGDVHTMADHLEAAADHLDNIDAEKANSFRRQAENLRNGRDRYD